MMPRPGDADREDPSRNPVGPRNWPNALGPLMPIDGPFQIVRGRICLHEPSAMGVAGWLGVAGRDKGRGRREGDGQDG
jgi:hypothetical protein